MAVIFGHVLTSVYVVSNMSMPRSLIAILNLWFLIGIKRMDIMTSTMSPICILHGATLFNLSCANLLSMCVMCIDKHKNVLGRFFAFGLVPYDIIFAMEEFTA